MSMWTPFTEAARRSMVLAQEEAQRLGEQDIHTRHLLLGILVASNSVAASALQSFGVTLDAARARAQEEPSGGTAGREEMSFTGRAKRIIELAFEEARTLNHQYISVEHLTLALLRMADGSAADIFTALGADRDGIRSEILQNIETPLHGGLASATQMSSARVTYQKSELHESTVDDDAIVQLQRWLDEAYRANIPEPNAMVLSSVGPNGQPSSRVVLLRKVEAGGLVFYTGYRSRKAGELHGNSRAALLFYWPELERQIRIEGSAEQVSHEQSDEYFASRPRGHQLSAWASEQSEIIESRELLEGRLQDYQARFEGEPVPRPHSWGGYIVNPSRVEFWQGRPNRLHDRLLYTREARVWKIVRLSP